MSPPLAATVKSCGSTSQVPMRPCAAAVVMRAPLSTSTWAPLVSIAPPFPPVGALASSVPSTRTVPASMLPLSTILPARFSRFRASTIPVSLTTLASRLSRAPALIRTTPPSARITPPFAARLARTLWSICRRTMPASWNVSVMALPAPRATLPSWAVMRPVFTTRLPSSATEPPAAVVIVPALTTPADPPPLKVCVVAPGAAGASASAAATSPPTSTCAPRPKTMPFGLIK